MNRRLSTTLTAAAGGALGTGFLSVAVASADNYTIVPDPASTETVTGLYGSEAAGPAIAQSVQGLQLFDVIDADGDVVGKFEAYEATAPYLTGDTSTIDFAGDLVGTVSGASRQLLVTSDVSGTPGTGAGDVPPAGSILATDDFGSGFENFYAALPAPGGDVVTDTLVTPFGNLDLSPLIGGFDTAEGLPAHAPPTTLPDDIVPTSAPQVFTAISGLSPFDIAVQGYQSFEFEDTDGNPVGTFEAIESTTHDITATHTQELLVTDDLSGTPGTGDGDVPSPGSVFNTMVFPLGAENFYSALPSPDGDVVTDIFVTPFGTFDLSPLLQSFDAAAGLADHSPASSFLFGDGGSIRPDPDSPEEFTGVNGLPPMQSAVQGYQLFDVTDTDGNQVGSFEADVANTADMMFSEFSQGMVATSDLTGTAGTAAGDVPPVGSVFDIVTFAGGFENIYSALPSTTAGGDVIADTLVTPLGNVDLSWFVQGFDAAAGLPDVDFVLP